jgi:hypothetical protein
MGTLLACDATLLEWQVADRFAAAFADGPGNFYRTRRAILPRRPLRRGGLYVA